MEKISHLWQQLFNKQTPWDRTTKPWTKGTGTQTDPFQIEIAEQLAYLAKMVNNGNSYEGKYFKMMNNLDLNRAKTDSHRREWQPIGLYKDKPFKGNFDGNGKTIANLYVNGCYYAGLFGHVQKGEITGIGIVGNSKVIGNKYTGGIVGHLSSASISNCYNTGHVYSSGPYSFSVGGIVGDSSSDSYINNCYNTGTVSSYSSAGGIAGMASIYSTLAGGIAGVSANSSISNCYNTGHVYSSGSYAATAGAGGIVGLFVQSSYISNCYNTGDVYSSGSYAATFFAGGIAGISSDSSISNCYNIGKLSSKSYAGGIIGWSSSSISNCYKLKNMITIDGVTDNGNKYGTVTTSEEMKTADFVKLLDSKNETTVWLMDSIPNINNGYPILKQTR